MTLMASLIRVKWMKLIKWSLFSLLLLHGILYSARVLQSFQQSHDNEIDAIPNGKVAWDCNRPEKPSVALTFDDGPAEYLDELFYLLELYNATATFFVNGSFLKHEVGLQRLRLIHAAGHQLASHTFSHQNLSAISVDEIIADMMQFDDWFQAALGFKPAYVRPPFGDCDLTCEKTLNSLGYQIVNWNLDLLDWADPNVTSASRAMDMVHKWEPLLKSGVIILLHDRILSTVRYLVPALLQEFSSMSYEFIPIAECFGGSRENWYR